MRLLLLISVIWCLDLSSAVPYSPLAELKKGVSKGIDVTKNVAAFTPGIDDMAVASKDLLLGAPIQVILEFLNQFCSLALATEGDLERSREIIPELEDVHITFLDDKYNRSFKVESVGEMVQLETFNKDNPTVLVTTGWLSMRGNKTSRSAEKLLRAYQCRGSVNFIVSEGFIRSPSYYHGLTNDYYLFSFLSEQLFDSGKYISTIYTWSARNTEILGHFLGEFLTEMSKHMEMDHVHLIGHSLGAQISGEAGRKYQEMTDKLLPRITALDPARPCFNEGETLNGVGRGDAAFVDVIHTNNGALGQRNPIGDADFYPNGVVILQPGSFNIGSSHKRAIELYAESVYPGNENTFLATKCNSIYSLNAGLCSKVRTPMGFAARTESRGNFFLKTASESPFGKMKINTCQGGASQPENGMDGEHPLQGGSATEATGAVNSEISTTTNENIGQTTTSEATTKKDRFMGVFG